jgi:hypothetical protein
MSDPLFLQVNTRGAVTVNVQVGCLGIICSLLTLTAAF